MTFYRYVYRFFNFCIFNITVKNSFIIGHVREDDEIRRIRDHGIREKRFCGGACPGNVKILCSIFNLSTLMSESLSDYNNNGKVIFGNVLGNVILKNAAKIINVFRTKDYLVLTMIDKYFSSELVQ